MNLFKNVDPSWIPLLHSLAYQKPLVDFLESLKEESFQPAQAQIFRVFEMPVKEIKVVILGQAPYPKPGDAVGLAFAVSQNSKIPVLLQNIQKEIHETEGIDKNFEDVLTDTWKTLEHLERQGVFLLNTSLTTKTGESNSHPDMWEKFTSKIISYISFENPCVWLLWGKKARSYSATIKNPVIVTGYDRETIEEIPIDPEINYIIPGDNPMVVSMGEETFSKEGFYYTNILLGKKSLNKIIW